MFQGQAWSGQYIAVHLCKDIHNMTSYLPETRGVVVTRSGCPQKPIWEWQSEAAMVESGAVHVSPGLLADIAGMCVWI